MKETKYEIGDLVKPNSKAFKRNNKDFTEDRRFIVTSIDKNKLFEIGVTWYSLAIKGSSKATFCLPEDELDLVKTFEWRF